MASGCSGCIFQALEAGSYADPEESAEYLGSSTREEIWFVAVPFLWGVILVSQVGRAIAGSWTVS